MRDMKQIMNVFVIQIMQWKAYFHSVKGEMCHSTRIRLDSILDVGGRPTQGKIPT